MSAVTLVSLDATVPQPWRNGGGSTRELLAWPSAADWQVRISVADVTAAGPFSRFDGVERWFAVLEGNGVELRCDAASSSITRSSEPYRFDGGSGVHCTPLSGATLDFNLMAPPGRGRLQRVAGRLETAASGLVATYAHRQPATLTIAGAVHELPPRHLAWCRLAAPRTVGVTGEDALWVEVRP